MAITYYEHSAYQTIDFNTPSGTYDREALSVTVGSAVSFRLTTQCHAVLNLSGTGEAQWETGVAGYIRGDAEANLLHTDTNHSNPFPISFHSATIIATVSGGLSGVTGIGIENGWTNGLYYISVNSGVTITPAKVGYTFDPPSFILNMALGRGVTVDFTAIPDASPPEKPTNPTPTDIGTGIILLPTLIWEAG